MLKENLPVTKVDQTHFSQHDSQLSEIKQVVRWDERQETSERRNLAGPFVRKTEDIKARFFSLKPSSEIQI